MADQQSVSEHYAQQDLLSRIESALLRSGKELTKLALEDLAPVDEFHIGGRPATLHLLNQLDINSNDLVLDVGCGLGGAARLVAAEFGCRVEGLDLTAEYVRAGQSINSWLGLADRVKLSVGSALELPFDKARFDYAYMLHVGMNISDKLTQFRQVARVLKPGGKFALFDVMRLQPGDLSFPVPWASLPGQSHVAEPGTYRNALQLAGFELLQEQNRLQFAREFFEAWQQKTGGKPDPARLGLHMLMGETASIKFKNMSEMVSRGLLAPVEMVANKI